MTKSFKFTITKPVYKIFLRNKLDLEYYFTCDELKGYLTCASTALHI